MSGHSPLPWKVDPGGFSSCTDYEQTWSVIGPPSDFMYLKNRADAEFIVTACNSHYAQAERIKALEEGLRPFADCEYEEASPVRFKGTFAAHEVRAARALLEEVKP